MSTLLKEVLVKQAHKAGAARAAGQAASPAHGDNNSVTQTAYEAIQFALRSSSASKPPIEYVKALKEEFSDLNEMIVSSAKAQEAAKAQEKAALTAEALEALAAARLEVVNLPLNTSIDFIYGTYLLCIEIIRKIKESPGFKAIVVSSGLPEAIQMNILHEFKRTKDGLEIVDIQKPDAGKSSITPFNKLQTLLSAGSESPELFTAYLNLLKTLINTLRISIEAYIQHLRFLQGRVDDSVSVDEESMQKLLLCFGIDNTVYNEINSHKKLISLPETPETFTEIFRYVFNYILASLCLYFLGKITSMEELQLAGIQSRLKGIYLDLGKVVLSAKKPTATITKEQLKTHIQSKKQEVEDYVKVEAYYIQSRIDEHMGICKAITVNDLLKYHLELPKVTVLPNNSQPTSSVMQFLNTSENKAKSFLETIKEFPGSPTLKDAETVLYSEETIINSLFDTFKKLFDEKIEETYFTAPGIFKRVSSFVKIFRKLRKQKRQSGGKLTKKRGRKNGKTKNNRKRNKKLRQKQTLRKRKIKARQTKRRKRKPV